MSSKILFTMPPLLIVAVLRRCLFYSISSLAMRFLQSFDSLIQGLKLVIDCQ